MTRRVAERLRLATAAIGLVVAGCEPVHAPPPSLTFAGLPVSGTVGDARAAGFTECVDLDAVHLRCGRHGVVIEGAGPYHAAVDLDGVHGEGGFTELTLWDDHDNDAVFRLADALERGGWSKCLTGDGRAGDQAVFTRAGAAVRMSMDISYWSKRRLRIVPVKPGDGRCGPHSVGRNSGTDR